jgi:riboflavin kinase/FMN adenylyltransferase
MVVTHGLMRPSGPTALTIGNFDGVHRGHRRLLDLVAATARELKIESCVLTFEPHPREFLRPQAAPARLTRLRDKLEWIAAAGIARTHVARFDSRFAGLAAGRFIEDILVRGLRVRWLLVGRDFRFGEGRAGDFATLESAAKRHAFQLEAMPDVVEEGERVSSSAVREALVAGDLRRAERLLGHPYTISGHVGPGARLGRSLGFPTANIALRRSPPVAGIFVVEVEGLGKGVASVGKRPTVNPLPVPLLEVHLLDHDEDLYGRLLRVRFLEKLRDEEKYGDLEKLREAIARDAQRARDYFAKNG